MSWKLALAGAALLIAAPAGAQTPQPDLEQTARSMTELDFERLFSDPRYAEETLGRLALIQQAAQPNPVLEMSFDTIRLVALSTLDRRDEALAILDRLLERRSRAAMHYGSPWYAALRFEDHRRAAAVATAAARNVPSSEWAALRELFEPQATWSVVRELRRAGDGATLGRLADSLLRIGWPGPDGRLQADSMRRILIDHVMEQGERNEAAEIATAVATPDGLLPLLLLARYDPIMGDRDRLALLRQAIAQEDRETAEALAASPGNPKRLLNRVHHLRGVGRDAEAAALVEPLAADVAGTVAAGQEGMWLINERAYALIADGRPDEGIALMRRLAALPIDDNPALISGSINYGEMLFDAGRSQEALDHALRLERDASQHASDYGDMWIFDTIVCSLAALDRGDEAQPWIERMRGLADSNPAALTHSYLCLGDDDAAAALVVRRLGREEDAAGALLSLQDYAFGRDRGRNAELQRRMLALRERSDVRSAIDRAGRVMTLPLSRAYWGNF